MDSVFMMNLVMILILLLIIVPVLVFFFKFARKLLKLMDSYIDKNKRE